jgi:hypothetical protein
MAAVPDRARQAFRILYVGFIGAPVLAGLDKSFNVLVDWEQYLAPVVTDVLPVSARTIMLAVGVVEIAAGVLVALRPRTGGYVVAVWLWAIIVNLLVAGDYFDIALRDLGLSFGALALAWLAEAFGTAGIAAAPAAARDHPRRPRRRGPGRHPHHLPQRRGLHRAGRRLAGGAAGPARGRGGGRRRAPVHDRPRCPGPGSPHRHLGPARPWPRR